MGCTDFIVKYALFVVNFSLSMVGLFFIGLTSFIMIYASALTNHIDDEDIQPNSFIHVTILGIVIFVISFLGCCGAIAEKPSLLNMYALVMLILSGITLFFLITIYSILRDWEYTLKSMERINEIPLYRKFLRAIEALQKCCGTTGADSYEIYGLELPPTCCPGLHFPYFNGIDSLVEIQDILISYNRTEHYCHEITSYDGCFPIINDVIIFLYDLVNNISIAILATQLIAAIFAFYLAQHIRNEVAAKNSPKSYTLKVKEKV